MKKTIAAFALLLMSGTAHAQTAQPFNDFMTGLSAATAPLNPSDYLYVLQSGNNRKVANSVVFQDGCRLIEAFGGAANNSTDNLAAWNAAVAQIAATSGSGCILFGSAGVYRFSARPTWTLPANGSGIVRGQGSMVTYLNWQNAAGGMVINLPNYTSAVHIQGLTFTTSVPNGGSAITLNQTNVSIPNPANTRQSTIEDVTLIGEDGGLAAEYWTDGTVVSNVSNVVWNNYNMIGSGGQLGHCMNIAGTAAVPAVVFALSNVNCVNIQYGMIIGNWVQGVAIGNGTNFTNGTSGIYIPATTTAGVAQIAVNPGTQFATIGHQIDVEGYFGNLIIQGALFYTPVGFDGVHINSSTGSLVNIQGNQFLALNGSSKGNGVNIVADASTGAGYIGGNMFSNINDGITLGAASYLTTIGPNSYLGNGRNVVDSAADTIYPDGATIMGGGVAGVAAATNTFIGAGSSTTERQAVIPSGRAIKVRGFQVFLSVAPGVGQTLTAAFRKNGGSIGPTCTVSGTNTSCSDTTHTTTLIATDVYDVYALSSAGAATTYVQWSAGTALIP